MRAQDNLADAEAELSSALTVIEAALPAQDFRLAHYVTRLANVMYKQAQSPPASIPMHAPKYRI